MQIIKEKIQLTKQFLCHSVWFLITHISSKFQCFIRIFTVVKLENKNRNNRMNFALMNYFCNYFLVLELFSISVRGWPLTGCMSRLWLVARQRLIELTGLAIESSSSTD